MLLVVPSALLGAPTGLASHVSQQTLILFRQELHSVILPRNSSRGSHAVFADVQHAQARVERLDMVVLLVLVDFTSATGAVVHDSRLLRSQSRFRCLIAHCR